MPSLLTLPRELRDRIISFVILAPISPPRDSSTTSDRTEIYDHNYREWGSWRGGKNIKYAKHLDRVEAIPTLLVNHQLRAESLDVLCRSSMRHYYALDVMIVKEMELWPTWLSVPALTTRVDEVNAAFRIIGMSNKRRTGFNYGNGAPPNIIWCFYSLLERFLAVGPIFCQEEVADKRICIKTLVLDFHAPDVPGEMLAPEETRHKWKYDDLQRLRKTSGKDYIMHPTFLLEFVSSFIMGLLGMNYHFASFGGILYERIGTIRLMLDGELQKEWDLAEELSEVEFNNSFGNVPSNIRKDTFDRWKLEAYRSRISLGLPVLPHAEVV